MKEKNKILQSNKRKTKHTYTRSYDGHSIYVLNADRSYDAQYIYIAVAAFFSSSLITCPMACVLTFARDKATTKEDKKESLFNSQIYNETSQLQSKCAERE